MYTVRCTRKLLRTLHLSPADQGEATSTALGDWYANLLYVGGLRLIHFLSELSRLSVIIPLKPAKTVFERHLPVFAELLQALDVNPRLVGAELEEMATRSIGTTRSRSVLGSMRTLSIDGRWVLRSRPETSLDRLNIELAGTPCLTIPTHFPDKLTRILLEGRHPDIDVRAA